MPLVLWRWRTSDACSCCLRCFGVCTRGLHHILRRSDPHPDSFLPSFLDIRICYNTAVNACAQSGEWKLALSLVDEMIHTGEGLPPDSFTFNSVMHGMASVGEWERLLGLLDGMQNIGVVPDVVSYNTAMNACNQVRWCWYRFLLIFIAALSLRLFIGSMDMLSAVSAVGSVRCGTSVSERLRTFPRSTYPYIFFTGTTFPVSLAEISGWSRRQSLVFSASGEDLVEFAASSTQ